MQLVKNVKMLISVEYDQRKSLGWKENQGI